MKKSANIIQALTRKIDGAPTDRAFFALVKDGQDMKKFLVERREGKVWSLCRKADGTLRVLSELQVKISGWMWEAEVKDYRKGGKPCDACAGCKEIVEKGFAITI